MNVRFATEADLDRVNELRKQVNDLHVKGKPEIFKPGFPQELRDHIYTIRDDPKQRIVVAERIAGHQASISSITNSFSKALR